MSVSNINNYINLLNINDPKTQEKKSDSEKNIFNQVNSSQSQTKSPGRNFLDNINRASAVLEDMHKEGLQINKSNISKYREELEADFKAITTVELKLLGVDENIEFKISIDNSGKVIVNSSHPDKDKVQEYFSKIRPELADYVKDIEALLSIERMFENPQSNFKGLKQTLQMESIDYFLNAATENGNWDFTSQIMTFSQGNLSKINRLNLKV